jgi:hypothetical protein
VLRQGDDGLNRAAGTPRSVAASESSACWGEEGEKPTGFRTDYLLTVCDSYSALQRF